MCFLIGLESYMIFNEYKVVYFGDLILYWYFIFLEILEFLFYENVENMIE